MKSLSQVFATLQKKNLKQYILLAGCCFFSVLLITAYVSMMRSPTVLNVLPEGGDSRKQVMMIFALAVIGCGVFTTYASSLFFRYKSRETGIFLALGASKKQIKKQITKELLIISLGSCILGALLGAPLAFIVWQFFRMVVVDTQEMALAFDPQAYGFALVFSAFVIIMLFFMLSRFIKRTNIIDVINEARKSETFKDVPKWYGPLGILLLIGGALLGYLTPTFCVRVLKWYPPEGLTSITYIPAFIGLYMILLHTVINGWRQGKNRYNKIISTSMMKFQGRQTVRNMLVITVLVAGAYFASFYTPMLGTGAMMGYDARPVDYAFNYRSDQNMVTEEEIRNMAKEQNVTITNYITEPIAILGVDGYEHIETEGNFGVTYTEEYRELLRSGKFLSESAYNNLTGENIDIKPGKVMAVFDDEGNSAGMTTKDVTCITNMVNKKVLNVIPEDYITEPVAILGVDGYEHIETEGNFGITYTEEYRELLRSGKFLSESAYNNLAGENIDIKPGKVMAVFDDEGNSAGMTTKDVTCITNMVNKKVLNVIPEEQVLNNSMLFGRYVLDDSDYNFISDGLTDKWLENQIFFNVENVSETYDFAKLLFYAIVDHSNEEVEVFDAWDPVQKILHEEKGELYWADKQNLETSGFEVVDYNLRDSSSFRMYWSYMPQFRVLDKADFVKTTAVFLMLFIFIAIVCFAAVIVITYTRSLTIGLTNAQVYDDLKHLGATNKYLLKTIKGQISKVYFVPIAAGTAIIYAFYMMIMFFNDGGSFSNTEIAGLINCLILISVVSILLYGVYRLTLHKVCMMLNVKDKKSR